MNGLATTMQNALRLIRGGSLRAATDVIQHKLREMSGLNVPAHQKQRESADTAARAEVAKLYRARSSVPEIDSTFTAATYVGPAGSRRYKLCVPAGKHASPLPLVVMLHGCTQSPDDFALGTGMNALAEDQKCVIAYPEQPVSANGLKCWNWFKSSDQQRDQGEPAIIAGITRELIATHGLDANRVYVAGLSAGGAMAVIMGRTYPDLYAAVGVHSGIPYAVAHDAPSAFAAMKGTASQPARRTATLPQLIPTIVLHGDRDKTVHPSNGEKLADQFGFAAGPDNAEPAMQLGQTESARERVRGGREYTRTLLRDDSGKVVVEYWLVHGAGHAWFGGNPAGSHTDPKGPDASKEMLRFFLGHELKDRGNRA